MNDFKDLDLGKYVKNFFLELEELSSSEVLVQLETLKKIEEEKEVPIYPFCKIVVEDGKRTVLQKKIEEKDAVELIYSIVGRVNSYIAGEAYRIVKKTECEVYEFCSFLEYLKKQATEEEKDLALEKFDDTFLFLEKVPIFQNIYRDLRQSYFSLLQKKLKHLIISKKIEEAHDQERIIKHNFQKRVKGGYPKRHYSE